ncbi:MAG: hypothetical protein NTX88_07260 [Candidatus Atribacteria bacterium]|nr:hypothetical protein [Candidatus Atribacteria bacterium]
MKNRNNLTFFIIAALLLAPLASLLWECQTKPHQQAANVANLRCEYLTNPLGIDVARPRLSWVIESNRRGERQTAFQVLVASSEELLKKDKDDLWDSRKVASDQSIQLEYAGKPLNRGSSAIGKCGYGIRTGRQRSGASRPSGRWGFLNPKTGMQSGSPIRIQSGFLIRGCAGLLS